MMEWSDGGGEWSDGGGEWGSDVFVGCGLWALGLLRVWCTSFFRMRSLMGVMSLLGVGSLLGVRLLLPAVVVLGLSWYERGGMGIPTYRDVGAK